MHAQAPTFRTGTTLVEFTVVALDGKGNPVTDGPEYQPEPQRNVTAVVLDMVNTAPPHQNGARAQLLRYLTALPENTPVGLFRFTERDQMDVLAPFTRRVNVMRSHLEAVVAASRQELVRPGQKGGPIVGGDCHPEDGGGVVTGASAASGGGGRRSSTMAQGMSIFEEVQSRQLSAINQTIRISRLDKTLANLQALGNHLAAIPGRKHVVWISSGMPIQLRAVRVNGNTIQDITSFEAPIRRAAQCLANQGIVIYPVDAKGGCRALDNSTTQWRYGLNDPPNDVMASLNVIADVTGGRVIRHDNDLTKGIVAAANDVRGTYTVGFYAANEPDDRWHAIDVSTKRRGIALRHRQGYLSRSG